MVPRSVLATFVDDAARERRAPFDQALRRALPFLTRGAIERIAAMAEAMREAALNDDACQAGHLRAAGFTPDEIAVAWPAARAAIDAVDRPDGGGTPLFTAADLAMLRRFRAAPGTADYVALAA